MPGNPATLSEDNELGNKPLVEAIIEVRWALDASQRDTAYPLYSGLLYERVKSELPFVEELPATRVPDEMTPYVVKLRFRTQENGWPLVQVGPGIFTINETEGYRRGTYFDRANSIFPKLLDAYKTASGGKSPKINSILIRYINAREFQINSENVLDFLKKDLHTTITLPEQIVASKEICGVPTAVNVQLSYPLNKPKGNAGIRLATGSKLGKDALIWELTMRSADADAPQEVETYSQWLKDAHELLERWFFSLIEGRLREEFK